MGSHAGSWTMILIAGMLAVLVLAAGMVSGDGAEWVCIRAQARRFRMQLKAQGKGI